MNKLLLLLFQNTVAIIEGQLADVKLGVDKLPNVSLSVFRDLRDNSLSMKDFPTDAFRGLKSLKEMWVSLKFSVSFAWKIEGVALYYLVPRFATTTFDLGLRLCAMVNLFCCGQSVPSRPLDNGGGRQSPKKIFSALRAWVWSKCLV